MLCSPILNFAEPQDDREPHPERPPKRQTFRLSQVSKPFLDIPRDKNGKLIVAMPKPAMRLRQKDNPGGN